MARSNPLEKGYAVPTYSCSVSLFKETPIEEAIARLAAMGFREIEIFDDGRPDGWLSNPARTRRLLEAAGLRVRTVHSPESGWDNANPDETLRMASVRACLACFGPAAEVGAEYVICHPNASLNGFRASDYGLCWDRSRRSLERFAEEAFRLGLKVAVENLPSYGLPRPGARVYEVLRLTEDLGEHVGICLDAGHSNASGLSAAQEALEAGARLFALHIQDNDGLGKDLHWLPGQGTTDWEAFLRALDALHFAGPRTFEVGPGQNLEETLAALAALRRAWAARGEGLG